jgi:nucleotide-binding universal stress UspA family protein
MPGIVVGVDGLDNALRALNWAMKEAAAHHAPLTVLAVHEVASSQWTGHPMVLPEDETLVEKTQQAAEEAVSKAVAQLGQPQPPSVTVRALSGLPAQALIDASSDADLLVVGSRGVGGFARLMIGSVSYQVVHHAHCPVVVVRHQDKASD